MSADSLRIADPGAAAREPRGRAHPPALAALRADVTGEGPGRFSVTVLSVPGCPVHHLETLPVARLWRRE